MTGPFFCPWCGRRIDDDPLRAKSTDPLETIAADLPTVAVAGALSRVPVRGVASASVAADAVFEPGIVLAGR